MTNALAVVASHPAVAVAAALGILAVSVAVARFIDSADEISLTKDGTLTARRTPRRPINGVYA